MIYRILIISALLILAYAEAYSQIEFENCESERLEVFLTDPDTSGTHIRKTPNGQIIDVVKNDPPPEVELYVMFEVCKMEGNWLLVRSTNNPKEVGGWIHNSVVSSTLAAYGSAIQIFDQASDNAQIIDFPKIEQYVKILASHGPFSKIEYQNNEGNKSRGFVRNHDLCGSPYTTCN